jgi:hypothetical protein
VTEFAATSDCFELVSSAWLWPRCPPSRRSISLQRCRSVFYSRRWKLMAPDFDRSASDAAHRFLGVFVKASFK